MSNNTCDILLCHYLSTKIKPKCGKLWGKTKYSLTVSTGIGKKERNSKCLHLYTSRSFGSLLVWSVQVCVNPVPSRKDTSNDLNE